jgi:hypothetical protein
MSEPIRAEAPEATTLRVCGDPTCRDAFDIADHMAGLVDAGPGHSNRLVHFLCTAHSVGEHVADWRLGDNRTAVPVCGCGWEGEPAENLAGAATQWCAHIMDCQLRTVLDFEGKLWLRPGAKETAIRALFGVSNTAYYVLLNQILDERAASLYAPMTVARLRRLRTGRPGLRGKDAIRA